MTENLNGTLSFHAHRNSAGQAAPSLTPCGLFDDDVNSTKLRNMVAQQEAHVKIMDAVA